MTRKDYNKIAAALAKARYDADGANARTLYEAIVYELSSVLAADNIRFNATRFVEAAHEWDIKKAIEELNK